MTELAALVPVERKLEILHPVTDSPLGVRIALISVDDDRLKKLRRAFVDKDQGLAAKKRNYRPSAEELESRFEQIAFTACQGWHWYNPTGSEGDEGYSAEAMPTFDGEVPEFNMRNFQAVTRRLEWFKAQINEALEETKDFLKV